MNNLTETLAEVYGMNKGQTVEFTSGTTVTKIKANAFEVTDRNGKVYSSLSRDHAAMIANKGE
jgi:hypothetical protein